MQISLLDRANIFWAGLPIRHRGAIVTAIPATCLLIALGAWLWSRQSAISVRTKIDHTQQIILEGENLLIELINAETGVRGFSATHDSKFLEPYTQAITSFPTALDQINLMIQQDPQHIKKLMEVKQLLQESTNNLEEIVAVTQSENLASENLVGTQSPRLIQLLYQGKTSVDAIRLAMSAFQTEQQRLLAGYLQQRSDVQERTTIAIWATVVVSLFASAAALYLFRNLDQELQKRERMLRESKSLLEAIVANVVDGVITLDEQGKIETFNPTAVRMFDYEANEVLGKDLGLLLQDSSTQNPSTGQPSEIKLSEINSKQDFLSHHHIQLGRPWQTVGLRKEGGSFPVEISISDMQISDMQFNNRLIAIIRDITEFQQTEAKLQTRANELARLSTILAKTNAALEDRNQELEQFAYVASHDLKAPLRAIANLSEWIEEDLADQLPKENQHQMQLLRGRVHRMEALINGLLEYSRVGRTQSVTETVAIDALLAEIIDSLAPPPSFSIEIEPGMPTLLTKQMPLRQVFANLIGNAVKHHDREDGHIKISAKDQEQFYEFSVEDDGLGIPLEYHNKIFVIFQTLEARDTKESTGIGLSIVKKIVETEGGKIYVESSIGKGTAFRFTWPKQPS